jgi:hypothetical protein
MQMLDNLKNPPSPFEHIITTHFRFKKKEIAEQLDSWIQLENQGGSDSRVMSFLGGCVPGQDKLKADVKELKERLRRL